MTPYLICLDLDGTLLTDEKVISSYTKKVLQTLRSQGHHLMIATGRPNRACGIYYNELNMDTPIVNFNGAYVHHPKDKNFKMIHEFLDYDMAKDIIKTLKAHHITNIIAEIGDQVYLDRFDQRLFDGFGMGNPEIISGDLLETLPGAPTTILVEAEEIHIPRVKQMLTRFYAENIEHRRWGDPFPVIEIVNKGISKARGIDYVKSYLNIDRSQIIAFGDEDNDIEMIKYAKYGVAMDNGLDELKYIANDIAPSNNEDGIGRYLNDFFNLNIPYPNQ